MEKFLVKHHSPALKADGSDGYYIFVAVIIIFAISTLAIFIGLGLALIA